jgi:DNA-binding HxlR family transcriptional regulator
LTKLSDLTHTQLILVTIFSGVARTPAIQHKLNMLGMPVSENTVRARLSEMKAQGLIADDWVIEAGPRYILSCVGELAAVEVTSQLTDAQLELFAQ